MTYFFDICHQLCHFVVVPINFCEYSKHSRRLVLPGLNNNSKTEILTFIILNDWWSLGCANSKHKVGSCLKMDKKHWGTESRDHKLLWAGFVWEPTDQLISVCGSVCGLAMNCELKQTAKICFVSIPIPAPSSKIPYSPLPAF